MAKCKKCGRRGLFLKLNRDGLCAECSAASREGLVAKAPPTKRAPIEFVNNESAERQIIANIDDPQPILHPDLEGLIWFADGPLQNYHVPESNHISVFTVDGEPSAIQTTLKIVLPKEGMPVESLGYYPSYSRMTPEQRGRYLMFLTNPYQEMDIGYVFVLYYGLERHLMYGDCERAFDVILKLRDAHRNASFQQYSASALIYTAMHRNSRDLYLRFIRSVDKQFEESIALDLLLLSKSHFGIDIQPSELMKHASRFGFSNKRYITTEHDTFLQELSALLSEKYGKPALPIQLLDLSALPTHSMTMFANGSIANLATDLPDVSEAYSIMKITSDVLQEAHSRVKQKKHPKKSNQV